MCVFNSRLNPSNWPVLPDVTSSSRGVEEKSRSIDRCLLGHVVVLVEDESAHFDSPNNPRIVMFLLRVIHLVF
jgi:hypothetical protein